MAKSFGLERNDRNTIYRLIAKWDLNQVLKTAKGYEDRLQDLIKDLTLEITLDSLIAMNGKLDKPQTTEIIFLLKSLCGFIEASAKESEVSDDSAINSLLKVLAQGREQQKNNNV